SLTGSVQNTGAHSAWGEGVILELRRVQDAHAHRFGECVWVCKGGITAIAQVADRLEGDFYFGDQMVFPFDNYWIAEHIRLPAQGVYDCLPCHAAGSDDIPGGGSVVRFCVPNDVNNVRFERHL